MCPSPKSSKIVEDRQRESEGGYWKQFFAASLQKHELLPASRGVLGGLVRIFRGVFVEKKCEESESNTAIHVPQKKTKKSQE